MNFLTLFRNVCLTILVAGWTIWAAHHSNSVHYPFLVVAIGSIALGFLDPKWGWIWVLTVCGLVVLAQLMNLPAEDRDSSQFASYAAPFPALMGGLLGRFSRKVI